MDKMKSLCHRENIQKLLLFFVFLFSGPTLFCFGHISRGLDESWQFYLNYAYSNGLVFGKDLFFTYGPLGFIVYFENVGNCPWISIIIWSCIFVVYFIIIREIYICWIEKNVTLIQCICFLLFYIMSTFLQSGYDFISFCIVLSACLIIKDRNKMIYPFIMLVTLSFFIKFSITIQAISIDILTSIVLIFRKHKIKEALKIQLIFPLVCILYLFYNPSLTELMKYIKGAVEISSGYGSAMSLYTYGKIATFTWILLGIILSVVFLIVQYKVNNDNFWIILVILCNLFWMYKQGFTRGYGETFYQGVALTLALLAVFLDWESVIKNRKVLKYSLIYVMYCIILVITYFKPSISEVATLFEKRVYDIPLNMITLLTDSGEDTVELGPEILRVIGENTVTSYPYELTYPVKHSIKFEAMPTLQSYTTYTVYLDNLCADFFLKEDAPNYIILTSGTIDSRIPYIETPATWNAIMSKYEFVMKENEFILLRRNDCKDNKKVGNKILDSSVGSYTMVEIPLNAEYVSIDFDISLVGRVQETLVLTPPVYMGVIYEDSTEFTGRIVPNVMATPFSLKSIIYGYDNLESMLTQGDSKQIEKIYFYGPGMRSYKDVKVTLYE